MTNEECKLIGEYMGWTYHVTDDCKWWNCIGPKGGNHLLDLNDAGLVVAEMQKRRDWEQFNDFVIEWGDLLSKASFAYITAWLMSMEGGQAKNFFKDFCEWRKGK
jgi:hypothetical protein